VTWLETGQARIDMISAGARKASGVSSSGYPVPQRKTLLLSVLLIVILNVAAFSPVLRCGFTNWDDDRYITGNHMIRELSPDNVKRIFTTTKFNMYTPLVILSFACEYSLFKLNPLPYHVDNLILHILNSLLVLWLFFLISGDFTAAFVAALLFSLSPLRVQSVAWVVERKGLLCALFFLSAFISHIHYVKKHQFRYYMLSLVFFVLSILSKPLGALLPFVLILHDYLIRGKLDRLSPVMYLTYLAGFLFAGLFAWLYLYRAAGLNESYPYPFTAFQSLFVAIYLFLQYLWKIAAPYDLCEIYPLAPEIFREIPLVVWLSPPILLTVIFLAIPTMKRLKKISPLHYHHVLFGLGFYLITIFPHLRILPVNATSLLALRHTYLPSIGILLIIGEGFSWLAGIQRTTFRKAALIFAVTLTATIFALSSFRQCGIYENAITLWNHVLARYPRYITAFNNRGIIYHRQGDYRQALENFQSALRIDPFDTKIRINIAYLYLDMHDDRSAGANLDVALYFNPDDPCAFYTRGNLSRKEKDYDRAIEMYTRAMALEPTYLKPLVNMGNICFERGDWVSARNACDRVVIISGSLSRSHSRHESIDYQNREEARGLSNYCRMMREAALQRSANNEIEGTFPIIYQD
jgi:tetratricopeptide (TPR) repeat protein